jgi:hypothetical protein
MARDSLHRVARAAGLATALFVGAAALAAVPSTQFSVTGAVQSPATYTLTGLEALPAITQTVSYSSGAGSQTHTYTGASLWGVLGNSGVIVNPLVKNDVLNKVVLATGSDGYQTVFSLGELSPDFGNWPDLVAYSELVNGVPTGLGADGFARITALGDVKGGRYVSNLVNLDVRDSGSTVAGSGGGASALFSVSGAVLHSTRFDLAALQALPATTMTVGAFSYTGVSFWDLLNSAVGIDLNPAVKNDVLGKYVVATGTDGYQVAFSLGELNPGFGNQPDLIAYASSDPGFASKGFARIVVPNDVKAGRWVSNLASLEVFSASPVPEPGSLALMLGGLLMVGRVFSRCAHTGRPGPHATLRMALPCDGPGRHAVI